MSLCITSIIITIMSRTYVQSQFHVEGVAMVTVLYYTQYLKLLSQPHECIPMLFVFFFCRLRFPFYKKNCGLEEELRILKAILRFCSQ